mmetsp:Transcript_17035/g.26511  ORF Transcript_17035/g.26511 Transcript_17035/m.26511 type:complete len:569 (+) Transcript_17035:50-1756(+)
MPFPTRRVESRPDLEEVFQENTSNAMQKSAVSNMIGLLEQMNKISLFAADIFNDILQTTERNHRRISTVKERISSIETKIEPIEKMFTENAPSYFYDNPYSEKEWRREHAVRGLLFRRERAANAINARRSVALPIADLSAMDSISMTGPCIKKFSDSNFFMNEWLEAEKKKMEEEKAKRRAARQEKKRKKRKRKGAEKITGIERWVYDPQTGKKVLQKAEEIAVQQYTLTDSNATNDLEFASSDAGPAIGTSKVAAMASQNTKSTKKKKRASKLSSGAPQHRPNQASYIAANIPATLDEAAVSEAAVPAGGGKKKKQQQAPPPNPMANNGAPSKKPPAVPPNPMMAKGAGAVPPNPMMAKAGGGAAPPPNPMAGAGPGAPPPVPAVPPVPGAAAPGAGDDEYYEEEEDDYEDEYGDEEAAPGAAAVPPPVPVPKKLTAAEMAARSKAMAGDAAPARPPSNPMQAQMKKPAPLVPMQSNALLAGIRGGIQLKKAAAVKREPKVEKRDMLLEALRKKGKTGLKKVAEAEKNVKVQEETDNTIYAILNRRQYMADDSESESDSGSWSDDDD